MEFETIIWIVIILLAIYALKAYAPQAYTVMDSVMSKGFSVLANWVTNIGTHKSTTTTEVVPDVNSNPA